MSVECAFRLCLLSQVREHADVQREQGKEETETGQSEGRPGSFPVRKGPGPGAGREEIKVNGQ